MVLGEYRRTSDAERDPNPPAPPLPSRRTSAAARCSAGQPAVLSVTEKKVGGREVEFFT